MTSLALAILLLAPPMEAETCSRVEQDQRQEERLIASRAQELRAQDEAAARAGTGELERNAKLLQFQADVEAFEQRYKARRANCAKTG